MPPLDDRNDPLADLRAEIAAEAAEAEDDAAKADADKESAPTKKEGEEPEKEEPDEEKEPESEEEADEGEAEGDEQEEGKEAALKAESKKEKRGKDRLVPISRVNEAEAQRRKAQRDLDAALAELQALKGSPDKDGEDKKAPDVEKIRAEERARVRMEMQVESFLNAGYSEYGQKEFDTVSKTIADLGAPDDFLMVAIEATGSAALGAKAVYLLGQEDADFIESVLKQSPLRMAATLARLANVRLRPAKRGAQEETEEEEEPAPRRKAAVSKAPAPLKPVNGHAHASDDEITDDLSEEEFTARFGKMMDRHYDHRH